MLQRYTSNLKNVSKECITFLKNYSCYFKILSIFLSFVIPLVLLYHLDAQSFDKTWKGRTFYLFFIWLVFLEITLNWEKIPKGKPSKIASARNLAFAIILLLPITYVITANYCGLNTIIVGVARQSHVYFAEMMPLSTEYLVFAVLFALIVLSAYGIKGIMDFSISTFFLGIIGMIYLIDNMFPFETFTPFQILVPATASLAANALNLMGYQTLFQRSILPGVPRLTAWNSKGFATFDIAWPCSGVESLLIYTVTISLFLKKSNIPWWQRIIYFVVGTIITYFINILRVATIFVIQINTGGGFELTPQATQFHDFYGPLYSIIWIISYPLIIIGSRIIWGKIKNKLQISYPKE